MRDHAIEILISRINGILGYDVVSMDGYNIDVEPDEDRWNGYTIICDDEDEAYNSLSMMLEGMALLNCIRGEN